MPDAYCMASIRSSVTFICAVIFVNYVCLSLPFAVLVFTPPLRWLGLHNSYGKRTFPRLNKQLRLSKPDGMFSCEMVSPAKMAPSEMLTPHPYSRRRWFTGCGETEHGAGGPDPERREDAGLQPGGAGAGGSGGAARHRGPGRQDLRPE